ncbi:hypothetical protein BU24DRAFT_412853 [Aaosphaeria arxii CBS 175.79]|uniref:Ubiquitin-like protease family profile domain-containing protein n=1 Tax=Aaosphaeria arxii CBS 175.79 TaxID=1450172 RepID=A0A6A5XHJ8_9PLEO|nr:uncharacterized protein BU24DRAFT_412853 [Aaosphaeria arxii CBS 175.79]KAF2012359.1 hypothetical protein BU24DRAFT_412853 [Aaosphaeria arxii CBS 175.79]
MRSCYNGSRRVANCFTHKATLISECDDGVHVNSSANRSAEWHRERQHHRPVIGVFQGRNSQQSDRAGRYANHAVPDPDSGSTSVLTMNDFLSLCRRRWLTIGILDFAIQVKCAKDAVQKGIAIMYARHTYALLHTKKKGAELRTYLLSIFPFLTDVNTTQLVMIFNILNIHWAMAVADITTKTVTIMNSSKDLGGPKLKRQSYFILALLQNARGSIWAISLSGDSSTTLAPSNGIPGTAECTH